MKDYQQNSLHIQPEIIKFIVIQQPQNKNLGTDSKNILGLQLLVKSYCGRNSELKHLCESNFPITFLFLLFHRSLSRFSFRFRIIWKAKITGFSTVLDLNTV